VGDVHTREFADQSPVFVEPGTDGCHAVDHASAGLVITQHFALANVSDPTSFAQKPGIPGQKPTVAMLYPPRLIAKPREPSVQMAGGCQETGFKSATAVTP
jgi:hypothetical protein